MSFISRSRSSFRKNIYRIFHRRCNTGGCEIERETVGERAQVKASGGIRTPEDAKKMLEAGADRIGAGNGVVLL